MDIPSIVCLSGSAFVGNSLQATRPMTSLKQQNLTNYVSLTEWCKKNFVSKYVGRKLIAKKFLVAQKLWGQWWVCVNRECEIELLEYLGLESLYFDAEN